MKNRALNLIYGSVMILCALTLSHCQKKNEAPKSESKTEVPAMPSQSEIAGEIFGVPVPMGNYYFAKRVHGTFQSPEERKMTPEEMEKNVWHNLILSYQASIKKIEITDKEFDEWTESVLTALDLKFSRTKDPAKYKEWVEGTLKGTVELFENQMRYLATIEKLKREMIKEMQVTVTDDEMKDDFMSTENHVGGEYTLFDTKKVADDFYEANHEQPKWEAYKAANADKVKPFMLITLQAIIDLWGVPHDQIYEFHAMPLGTVGKPLPFGTQWGVFRLQEKRTGDLANFEAQKEKLKPRVEARKQYQARNDWLEEIDKSAPGHGRAHQQRRRRVSAPFLNATRQNRSPNVGLAQQLRHRERTGARVGAVQHLLHFAAAGHVERARQPMSALLGVLRRTTRHHVRKNGLKISNGHTIAARATATSATTARASVVRLVETDALQRSSLQRRARRRATAARPPPRHTPPSNRKKKPSISALRALFVWRRGAWRGRASDAFALRLHTPHARVVECAPECRLPPALSQSRR